MILTFRDKDTKQIYEGNYCKSFPVEIQQNARRKLYILYGAVNILDLRIPPGNRLHALEGNRKGQHSISINEQWRICFKWIDGNAYDVEIVDYH